MLGRPSTQGASNLSKRADQNFGPFLPPFKRWLNLVKIFSLFNTQPNRPRVFPASFKHVGQTLYSRGFKFGGNGPIKILVHFCLQVHSGWIWSVSSLFYTQPNRIRAFPASFKHVGQTLYSKGFKFGGNGPIKILVHFCLQVHGGWIWSKFSVFSTQPNRPRAFPASFKHVGQKLYSRGFKFGETGR